MQLATLEEIRLHLNMEQDDLDDDMQARLEMYRLASIEMLKNYLNAELYEDEIPEDVSNGRIITAEMKQAQLLIIGDFYLTRENASGQLSRSIPVTAEKILNKKRLYNV